MADPSGPLLTQERRGAAERSGRGGEEKSSSPRGTKGKLQEGFCSADLINESSSVLMSSHQ